MREEASSRWRFGPFVLDRTTRELFRDGERRHLAKRPFDVLEYLVAERPRLVSRSELLQRYWSGRDVYEDALTRCVSSIRKALDDREGRPQYLETRWHDGYRFIGEVEQEADSDPRLAADHRSAAAATGAALPIEADATRSGPDGRSGRRLAWIAVAAAAVAGLVLWYALGREVIAPDPLHAERIAVLPLAVSGLDAPTADGLNEELLAAIARIEGLQVIARGSVLRSAEASHDPVQIGRELGVQALVTGSARRSDEHVVVSVRLLDARDASVSWSYEARTDASDLARSPRDVAARLATHLSARLRLPPPVVVRNPDAYSLYLRARHYWNQRTAASLREAIRLFERAIALEPDYGDAHAGLAEAWLLMPMYAGARPTDTHPRARAAAEAALRLNPESSRAHVVLAVVSSQFEWNWRAADQHFTRAIELDPNNATAWQWRGESYCFRRQFDRCAADLREALAIDPLSPMLDTAQGLPARFAGDPDRAQSIFAAALRRHPSFALAELELGFVASDQGRWDEAIAHYEGALPALGPVLAGAPLGYAYARAGRSEDARRVLADLTRLSATQYVPPIAFAHQAIGAGDRELALAWLERAVAVHDDFITQMSVDHHYRELHGDPRFRAIMARVGTPLPADGPR